DRRPLNHAVQDALQDERPLAPPRPLRDPADPLRERLVLAGADLVAEDTAPLPDEVLRPVVDKPVRPPGSALVVVKAAPAAPHGPRVGNPTQQGRDDLLDLRPAELPRFLDPPPVTLDEVPVVAAVPRHPADVEDVFGQPLGPPAGPVRHG